MWSLLWAACSQQCPGRVYVDGDGDGVGGEVAADCSVSKLAAVGGDCNDSDPSIFPGAEERCDTPGIDDDCDGRVDDQDDNVDGLVAVHLDLDGDGFGTEETTRVCAANAVEPAELGDCDDGDALRYPGAEEIVDDGIDQDCSGHDDCYYDADKDGYAGERLEACDAPDGGFDVVTDCNDANLDVHPHADDLLFDGFDSDCDGLDTPAIHWPNLEITASVEAAWVTDRWGIAGRYTVGYPTGFATLVLPDELALPVIATGWYGALPGPIDVGGYGNRLVLGFSDDSGPWDVLSLRWFEPVANYPFNQDTFFEGFHDGRDLDMQVVDSWIWTVSCGSGTAVTRSDESSYELERPAIDLAIDGEVCWFSSPPTAEWVEVGVCGAGSCQRFELAYDGTATLLASAFQISEDPGWRAFERENALVYGLDQGPGVRVQVDGQPELHLLADRQLDDAQAAQLGSALYVAGIHQGALVLSRWQGGSEIVQELPVLDPATGQPRTVTDVALASGGAGLLLVFVADGHVGWASAPM